MWLWPWRICCSMSRDQNSPLVFYEKYINFANISDTLSDDCKLNEATGKGGNNPWAQINLIIQLIYCSCMTFVLTAHHNLKTALVTGNAGGIDHNFCAQTQKLCAHIVSHCIWGSQGPERSWILATLFSIATELVQMCSLIWFKEESVDKESVSKRKKVIKKMENSFNKKLIKCSLAQQ